MVVGTRVGTRLDWLRANQVTEVVLSIEHLGGAIRASVGDGTGFGLRVVYVDEGQNLLGTAGALRRALDEGALAPWFFVLYGDSYLPVALAPVADAFRARAQPALMTVFRNFGRSDTSNVIYRDGTVVLYDKARAAAEMEHIDYGLSILTRAVIEERVPPGVASDLASVYHRLRRAGELAGLEVHERFYEIGSPQRLHDLEALLGGSSPGAPAGTSSNRTRPG